MLAKGKLVAAGVQMRARRERPRVEGARRRVLRGARSDAGLLTSPPRVCDALHVLRHVLLCLALCACPLQKRTTPIGVSPVNTGSFAGTYSAEGGSLALQAVADGRFTGTFDSRGTTGTIDGRQNGAQLVGTATTRDKHSFGFVAYLTANGIEISFDNAPSVRFARTNRAAMPAPTPSRPPTSLAPPARIAASTELAPAPASAGATGLLFRDELGGWELRTPEGWKYLVRGPSVVFSSDTEPGLIVVSFQRGLTADKLESGVGPMLSQLAAVQTGAPARTARRAARRSSTSSVCSSPTARRSARARSRSRARPAYLGARDRPATAARRPAPPHRRARHVRALLPGVAEPRDGRARRHVGHARALRRRQVLRRDDRRERDGDEQVPRRVHDRVDAASRRRGPLVCDGNRDRRDVQAGRGAGHGRRASLRVPEARPLARRTPRDARRPVRCP